MTDSSPAAARFREAVEQGNAAAVRDLLARDAEARALIDEPIFYFDSPALVANSGNLAMVEALLEFGADPNRKSSWWAGGFHPLYGATPEAAERLVAAGAVVDACAAAAMDRPDLLEKILRDDPSRVRERG